MPKPPGISLAQAVRVVWQARLPHRAPNLIVDPRDQARAERLNLIAGEAGAFRCHTLGNCRDVCPRGISPTHSIERLKRLAVWEPFRMFFTKIFPARQ